MSLSNAGDEQAAAAAAALEDRGGAGAASAAEEVPANRFDMVMKKTRGISVVPYGLLQVTAHVRCMLASGAQPDLVQALWCKAEGASAISFTAEYGTGSCMCTCRECACHLRAA